MQVWPCRPKQPRKVGSSEGQVVPVYGEPLDKYIQMERGWVCFTQAPYKPGLAEVQPVEGASPLAQQPPPKLQAGA